MRITLKRLWLVLACAAYGCTGESGDSANSMDAARAPDGTIAADASLGERVDAATDDARVVDAGAPMDSGMEADGGTMPATAQSVLFVGNSFTFWMDGLDTHLAAFHGASGTQGTLETDAVVRGGASLEVMWERTPARRRIENGSFDVVVLQEDIPETDVETFFVYARRFVETIRAAGGRPVLFMAWDYARLGWISMDEIAEAHLTIAAELEVEVVPAGLAWQRAATARPALSMYDQDEEHPSIHGVYLNTCVVYARLFGESPIGNAYRPAQEGGVTDADALFLQTIAWETVNDE